MKVSDAIEKRFRNIDIEYQIAAFAMRKKPETLSQVEPVWFSNKLLGQIASLLKIQKVVMGKASILHELKSSGKSFDKAICTACLDRLLKERISQLSGRSARLLVSQLYELYESRRCLRGIGNIVKSIKSFDLEKAKDTLRKLSRSSTLTEDDRVGDYLEDYEGRVLAVESRSSVAAEEGQHVGIPTGILRFDRIIGGLMPGEFGVIAGKPGVGKTAMLVAFAIHAWLMGFNVLFCSGEMSKELIEFRIDANLAGIPVQHFRTGDLEQTEWKRWKSTVEKLRAVSESFLEISAFPRNFTAADIESEAVRVQEKWSKQVHLLCIDYLNIMDPIEHSHDSSKSWGSQADIVWQVKGLVAELNGGISAWSAGQIVDDAFNSSRLQLHHLKYTRAISETAPIVTGIVETADDNLEDRLQFQVLKMRSAPPMRKALYLYPNLELMRIHEQVVKKKDLLFLREEFAKPKRKSHNVEG